MKEEEIKIFEHDLVPKHILLSDQEKEGIMKQYGIKKLNQFPKILKSDPAVVPLKTKTGDIIKIIRKNEAAIESIYYRVVIEG